MIYIEMYKFVFQVLDVITNNLGYNCRDSDNEKTLMSLKALGNTGIAAKAVPVLARCVAQAELPMEIRVAAVEAFHRMPCDNVRNVYIHRIYLCSPKYEGLKIL